ncbi:RNA_pol_Rpb2_6 domain-containing protein [Trichonephila clavipes]|nr:RNA_pol_Rpb2_6 domain-containing protein [Trichonephila clavipes]
MVTPPESHQEIGSNGEVFVEKTIGCYREVNMQTYPLNPYLSYLIVRQMSNKVKHIIQFPPFTIVIWDFYAFWVALKRKMWEEPP